jgi:TatA/E family protein of Tat protein translocase
MGIESPVHLLFIALVALIVLGPKRLPSLARAIGQGIREFRGALEQAQEEDPEPPEAPAPAANAQAPPPAEHAQAGPQAVALEHAQPAPPPAEHAQALPPAEHAQPQAVAADTLHQPDQGA